MGVGWTVNGLRFNAGAGSFVLGGQAISLGGSGIVSNASALQTINNSLVLLGNQDWATTAGNLTLGGDVSTGGFQLTVNPSSSRTISLTGVVSGSGRLVKTGAGTAVINGNNTFVGGASLAAGTVTAGHDNAFGAGGLTLSGAALSANGNRMFGNATTVTANTTLAGSNINFNGSFQLGANSTLTINNSRTTLVGGLGETGGPRALTKAGNGILLISSTFAATGPVTLTAGLLALDPGVSLPSSNLRIAGGVLASSGTLTRTLGTGSAQLQFTAGGGFAAYGGSLTISGFTGTWGSTPSFLPASGTLTLGSAISDNVVTWTGDFSLGSGTRTINAVDNTSSGSDRAIVSGVISGSGGLAKVGSGRLDLTALNTFTGQISLGTGTLGVNSLANEGTASSLGAAAGASAPILMGLGTTGATLLYLGTGHSTDRAIYLNGSTGGAVLQAEGSGAALFAGGATASAAGAKTLTLTGSSAAENAISGSIANGSGILAIGKAGTGTWILSGSNTYMGATALSAGTLGAGSDTAFGAGSFVVTGGTLAARGGSRTLANTVVHQGTFVIGGSNSLSFTGGWNMLGGNRTLTVNNTAATTLSGTDLTIGENNVARTLAINGSGNVFITSVIKSGPGIGEDGLAKSGAGALTLSGSNTYTGSTSLSAGLLALGNNNALGTGVLVLTSGTVTASGGARAVANAVTHQGNIVIGGSNALTLSGSWTMSNSRTLTVNNTALTTLQDSVVTLGENNTARTLTINGSGNLVIASVIQNGPATGADNLTQAGSGKLTLTGTNTYTGATTLTSGTLAIGNNAAFGTGTLRLNGGVLSDNGAARILANTTTLGGNSTLADGSTLAFNGTLTNSAGNRTFTVNSNALATFASVNLSENATSRILTFAGSGTAQVNGVIANGGGSTAGGLAKSGTGFLVLNGSNTYGGATAVNAGTLEVRSNTGLGTTANGTTVAAGATLALSNSVTTAENLSLSGSGVAGAGALRNLSGTNTVTGSLTQAAASTIVSSAGQLNLTRPTGDSIAGAFALTIGGAGNIFLQRRYNIGSAPLVKNGSGTLTLASSGTSATSGNISVLDGLFEVNGSVATGGTLLVSAGAGLAGSGSINRNAGISGSHSPGAVGSAGQQTFSAGLAYNSGSMLNWQLQANTTAGPGTNFDRVLVTGGNLVINPGSGLALVFNAPGSSVNWAEGLWNTNQQWLAVALTGAGTSSGLFGSLGITSDSLGQTLGLVRPGSSFSVVRTGNDIYVLYAVPEPSLTAMLAVAAGWFLTVRGRRRTRTA